MPIRLVLAAYALALLEGGAERRAYLLKERVDDLEGLAAAIRSVAAGGSVIDTKVVEALVAAKSAAEPSPLGALRREGDPRRLPEARPPHRAATAYHRYLVASKKTYYARARAALSCFFLAFLLTT